MRLHRLELSAFGPFPGAVRIDFDALAADGLFLLHGETGAGKTTILDAVAFALYGRVPGVRGEAKRLRCDRADAATPTSVTLDLSVGARRLEITRSPEYLRPKARGTGTTKAKASVTLRWIGAPPAGLAPSDLTRAEEVGDAVLDLLGMSADQFFQVVLLPQGEFARFLRADTAEREVLLERLFDTSRFARLEAWFVERRRTTRAALDGADLEVARERARLAEASGPGEPAVPEGADASWLSALVVESERRRDRAVEVARAARAARDAAAAAAAAGRRRDAAVAKVIALEAEKADVAAHLAAHTELLAAVEAAERAVPVAAAAAAVDAAVGAESDAAQALRRARESVPEGAWPELGAAGVHDLDLDAGLFSLQEDGSAYVPDADADVLHAAADSVRDQAGALGAMLGLAEEQERDLARRAELRAAADSGQAELAGLQVEVARLPDLRRTADGDLAAVRLLAAGRPDRDAAVGAATAVHRAAVAVPGLVAKLADARRAFQSAVDGHQRARDERQRLVEVRIAGMAAELAGQLTDGAPCGVCGSTEHPAPARPGTTAVDAASLAAARGREGAAESARQEAESVAAAVQNALTEMAAIAGGRDAAVARAELDGALAAQREAVSAESLEPTAAAAVQQLSRRQSELDSRCARLLADLEGTRRARETLDAAVGARGARLAEAAGGFETVTARRDHLLGVATALDGWAAAAESLGRARVAARLAERQRDKAVADAGFPDVAEALAAARLDRVAAGEQIRRFRDRQAAIRARSGDPDLAVDGPLDRVDLADLDATARRLSDEADRAVAAAHGAEVRCTRVAAAGSRLSSAWAARVPLAGAADRAAALADVISGRGQNARALSLRSYVLAAKLQQVAAVAGTRLARMSGGRYSFAYSEERESRGRSGGLGLDVMDGHSGMVRSAKTLSGGESFLASLALALGLADVVAAESGGRMLDTIFIDEGFGSLDADSLDLVMATLDELRAGGRVVAVVSHVDEMRQRIPTRLRVRKTPRGSAVEMTAPGPR